MGLLTLPAVGGNDEERADALADVRDASCPCPFPYPRSPPFFLLFFLILFLSLYLCVSLRAAITPTAPP